MNNQNENNNMADDFKDINEKNKKNYVVIVSVLYVMVIILTIFLVIGIKNQKDVVAENYEALKTKDEVNVQDNNSTSVE